MKTFVYKCLICIFGLGAIWLLCGIPDPSCTAPWWVWVIASFVSGMIAIYLLGVLYDAEQKEFQREINKKSGRGVITMKNKEEYANNPTIIYCEVVPGCMIEVKGVTQNHVYFMAENKMHRVKLKYHEDGSSYFKWMNQRITID